MYHESNQFGGSGGTAFAGKPMDVCRSPLTEVRVYAGGALDAVELVYNGSVVRCGGPGGRCHSVPLARGVTVTGLRVYQAKEGWLSALTVVTSDGRSHGPYGPHAGLPTSLIEAPAGAALAYVSGRAGGYIDALKCYWQQTLPCLWPESKQFGGSGGTAFEGKRVDLRNAPLTEMRVYAAGALDAVELVHGSSVFRYGGPGGRCHSVPLARGVTVTGLRVYQAKEGWLSALTVVTSDGRSHGPYGAAPHTGTPSLLLQAPAGAALACVSGRAGGYLDALKCHWQLPATATAAAAAAAAPAAPAAAKPAAAGAAVVPAAPAGGERKVVPMTEWHGHVISLRNTHGWHLEFLDGKRLTHDESHARGTCQWEVEAHGDLVMLRLAGPDGTRGHYLRSGGPDADPGCWRDEHELRPPTTDAERWTFVRSSSQPSCVLLRNCWGTYLAQRPNGSCHQVEAECPEARWQVVSHDEPGESPGPMDVYVYQRPMNSTLGGALTVLDPTAMSKHTGIGFCTADGKHRMLIEVLNEGSGTDPIAPLKVTMHAPLPPNDHANSQILVLMGKTHSSVRLRDVRRAAAAWAKGKNYNARALNCRTFVDYMANHAVDARVSGWTAGQEATVYVSACDINRGIIPGLPAFVPRPITAARHLVHGLAQMIHPLV